MNRMSPKLCLPTNYSMHHIINVFHHRWKNYSSIVSDFSHFYFLLATKQPSPLLQYFPLAPFSGVQWRGQSCGQAKDMEFNNGASRRNGAPLGTKLVGKRICLKLEIFNALPYIKFTVGDDISPTVIYLQFFFTLYIANKSVRMCYGLI